MRTKCEFRFSIWFRVFGLCLTNGKKWLRECGECGFLTNDDLLVAVAALLCSRLLSFPRQCNSRHLSYPRYCSCVVSSLYGVRSFAQCLSLLTSVAPFSVLSFLFFFLLVVSLSILPLHSFPFLSSLTFSTSPQFLSLPFLHSLSLSSSPALPLPPPSLPALT